MNTAPFSSMTIPPVFVSHGAPTLLLDPGRTGPAWQTLAASLPRPRAIVAVSAHWTTRSPAVSAAPMPDTIHDFGGFPDELYRRHYHSPGAPELAQRMATLVPGIGLDPARGLDHGAWVPLSFMFPAADIPVIQLSVMPHASPADHLALGRQLAPLTHEGVLVLASGGLTHNLHDVVWNAGDDAAVDYAAQFRDWFVATLMADGKTDYTALCDYQRRAPHARRAHPSPEHLLPVFVALGAAGVSASPRVAHQGYTFGALAMDAFVFQPDAAGLA